MLVKKRILLHLLLLCSERPRDGDGVKLRNLFGLLSKLLSLSIDFPLLTLSDFLLLAVYYELELEGGVALRQRVRDDVCHGVLRHFHVCDVPMLAGRVRHFVWLDPELRVDEGLHLNWDVSTIILIVKETTFRLPHQFKI